MRQSDIITLVAGILIVINDVAVLFGFDYGIDDNTLMGLASLVVTIGWALWGLWHNFNITEAAKAAQQILDAIKSSDITKEQVEEFLANVKEGKDGE